MEGPLLSESFSLICAPVRTGHIVYFVYLVDILTECSPRTMGIATMKSDSLSTTGIVIAVVLCFIVVLLLAVVLIVLLTCRWKRKQRSKVGSFSFCTD